MNIKSKKSRNFSNILYKNINEFNVTLLIVLGVLFIMLSGFTSYALFSDTIVSDNIITLNYKKKNYTKTFDYTGSCEEYVVPYSGYYQIEAYGGQGGSYSSLYYGGLGAYTSGIIKLIKGDTLYFCVGGAGVRSTYGTNLTSEGGFNGGGDAYTSSSGTAGSGGGATDVRLVGGNSNDEEGLNSRIMVAAGGGGGYYSSAKYYGTGGSGGGLYGTDGYGYVVGSSSTTTYTATGGTQTSSTFGYGSSYDKAGMPGAGSGYYGGTNKRYYAAAGGSSFISGYAGVNAIASSTDRTHTNDTLHYSNKYFIDGQMKAGVNQGNGKAIITYISNLKPERENTTLNNVRYIKDCMNGSSYSSYNLWVEMQAIYNGANIAKGLSGTLYNSDGSTTTSYNTTTRDFSLITDGDITSANYSYGAIATGNQCYVIDLGANYDLDEIAVWHYWADTGRTFYDNYTYVSSDNINWTIVIDQQESETVQGKRTNAYESKNMLYDVVKSNVKTTNISYQYINGANKTVDSVAYNVNDNGVFLYKGKDDNAGSLQIYYYRGNVTNNNVLFGGFCWKIVRTTSTGGTKLIYNGVPTNGKCNNTGNNSVLSESGGFGGFSTGISSPSDVGYMYGTRYTYAFKNMSSVTTTYMYGNDVTYSDGTYTLKDTTTSSSWSSDRKTLADGYHYTCLNSTGTCTSVRYITYFGLSNGMYYLTFTGGDTLDTAKTKMFTNTTDSLVKSLIDDWYEENLTSYTSYLENAIFCNDRSFGSGIYGGALGSKDTNSTASSIFASYERQYISYTPSLQCTNRTDQFSLKVDNGGVNRYGNNALIYPVALLTGDEAMLAGAAFGDLMSNTNYYLYNNVSYWNLSPIDWGYKTPSVGVISSNGYLTGMDSNDEELSVRPVVSLKFGTEVLSGTGSTDTPYVVG